MRKLTLFSLFLFVSTCQITRITSHIPKNLHTLTRTPCFITTVTHTPYFEPKHTHTSQHPYPLFATHSNPENLGELDTHSTTFPPKKKILRLPKPPLLVQNETLTLTGQIFAGAISKSLASTALHPISYSTALEKHTHNVDSLSLKNLFEQSKFWWNGAGTHFLTSLPFGAMAIIMAKSSRNLLGALIPWIYAKPFLDYSSQAFSTIFSTFLSAPQAAVIKNIISGNSTNIAESVSSIFNKKGLGGFYEGYKASLIKRMPTMLLSIAITQQLKSALSAIPLNKSAGLKTVVIGLLATSITTSLISPYETLKTKVENEMDKGSKSRYSSTWGALRELLQNKNISELLSNVPSKLYTTVPPIGLQTCLFEIIKFTLIRRSLNKNNEMKTHKYQKQFNSESTHQTNYTNTQP